MLRIAYAVNGSRNRSGGINPATGKKKIGGSMVEASLRRKINTPPQLTKKQGKKKIGGSMA